MPLKKKINKKKKVITKKISKTKKLPSKKTNKQIKNKKIKFAKKKIKKIQNLSNKNKLYIIPEHSNFIGSLHYPFSIVVNGIFDGQLNARSVEISQNCSIKGEIHCETIIVHGTCQADIYVKKSCVLSSTSILNCEIYYDSDISIQSGAKILGRLIPKKPPLALPNYSNKNNERNISQKDNVNEIKKEEDFVNPTQRPRTRNENSIDKIISKIFK